MQPYKKKVLFIYLLLFNLGCDTLTESDPDNNENIVEVVTSDFGQEPYYYNFLTNMTDATNWHISLQNIAVDADYSMPSVILNSNVLISIYNTISFDDIITVPNNIEWSSDTSLTSYNKEYEVLHYMYNCSINEHSHTYIHKIMVMSNNYLLKEISTNNIYKLHFEEYDSYVVLFKFVQLNIDD